MSVYCSKYAFLTTFLFIVLATADDVHEIWLTTRSAYLRCGQIRVDKKYNQTDEAAPTKDFDSRALLALTIWYDKNDQLIQIGQTSTFHLPSISAAHELFPVQSLIGINDNTSNINWSGPKEWGQLTGLFKSESVRCHIVRLYSMEGNDLENWDYDNRPLEIIHTYQFSFQFYIRPELSWIYKFKQDIIQLDKVIHVIRSWCNIQQKAFTKETDQKFYICTKVFEQRVHDTNEMIIKEIVVNINLPNYLWTMNPIENELNFHHARLKYQLDLIVTREAFKQMSTRLNIPTEIKAVCTVGSRIYASIPSLKPLMIENNNEKVRIDEIPKNSSAFILTKWPLLCRPCPKGQAPKLPYSFNNCHSCPKGTYLGEEFEWPVNFGCTKCPKGFTTSRDGAISKSDCRIDAGLVMSTIITKALKLENTLAYLLEFGNKWSTSSSYGKYHLIIPAIILIYLLFIVWLYSMAFYRLKLYFMLKNRYRIQFRKLLRANLIGQINIMIRLKHRVKSFISKKSKDTKSS